MTNKVKICTRCQIEKPIEAFSRNRSKAMGRQCLCRECYNDQMRTINRLHREHRVPEGHVCPICSRSADELHSPSSRTKTPWRLDHDYETGKFRGFLCDRCNIGLGKFADDPDVLIAAIDYLKRSTSYDDFA